MLTDLKIDYADVDDLYLDPLNPRLGRKVASERLSQAAVLDQMRDWTLEELAESFVTNGFWPQEALIVVKERLGGSERLVVIEGNRRLAALKCLDEARKGSAAKKQWREMVASANIPASLLKKIPYIDMQINLRTSHLI